MSNKVNDEQNSLKETYRNAGKLGAPALFKIYTEKFSLLPVSKVNHVQEYIRDHIKNLHNDFFYGFFHQDSSSGLSLPNAVALLDLYYAMQMGEIYISVIPTQNWAFPNVNIKMNKNTIEAMGLFDNLVINCNSRFEDGHGNLNQDLVLKKLGVNSEESMTSCQDVVVLPQGTEVQFEIGTNPVVKLTSYLSFGHIMCRIPFPLPPIADKPHALIIAQRKQ